MLEKNHLELAKQGNLEAISALINRSLSSKGISARVKRRDDCLQIMLESDQIPNQRSLTSFVQNGILKLDIQGIRTLKIFGRIKDDEMPAWSQMIPLTEEHQKRYMKKEEVPASSLKTFQKLKNTDSKLKLDPSRTNCPFDMDACSLKHLKEGQIDDEGKIIVLCASCSYRYCLTSGKLDARYSRQNTVKRQSKKSSGVYKREYEIRLLKPDGQINEICFEIEGKEDKVKVRKGDFISVLQTLNEYSVADTVSVYNHTTNKDYKTGEPDSEAKAIASLAAFIQGFMMIAGVFILYFFAMVFLGNLLEQISSFFMIIVAIGWFVIPIILGVYQGMKAYKTQFEKHSIKVRG
jgi:hypothetical protein